MSRDIWTECAGDSEIFALRLEPWRVVESQHRISTRKLVATLDEQAVLEEIIDRVKPPNIHSARQHYLLTTPFRYPPLKHGSRFGSREHRGIWYGSVDVQTAMAEVAYYRLLFLEGTSAPLPALRAELTAYSVRVRTDRGVNLSAGPFTAYHDDIASRTSYSATQQLGAQMRLARVEVCRYPSARAVTGDNVAVFTPAAFCRNSPRNFQQWRCLATTDSVEFVRGDLATRETHVFPRSMFLVNDMLPAPAF